YYLPDHDKIEFAVVLGVSHTVNLVSVGGARLDDVYEYDETTTGYIDGSLDSSAGIEYSWEGEPFNSITFAENDEPDVIVIAPPAPVFGDIAYTLPEDERWTWLVNDEPAAAGTYPVTVGEDPVTITVQPVAA